MQLENSNNLQICNTTRKDLDTIVWLFDQAIHLHGKNGYKTWSGIDSNVLKKDIDDGRHYKIANDNNILCIFSIQYTDPFIWRDRDQDDALYLHRIVTDPAFKGQKLFQKVLNWTKELAVQKNLKFIRMDTWADNKKIIDYYKSFGFEFIENYQTPDIPDLPFQNRNLNLALLQMEIKDSSAITNR